jgi:hypothetical protein
LTKINLKQIRLSVGYSFGLQGAMAHVNNAVARSMLHIKLAAGLGAAADRACAVAEAWQLRLPEQID